MPPPEVTRLFVPAIVGPAAPERSAALHRARRRRKACRQRRIEAGEQPLEGASAHSCSRNAATTANARTTSANPPELGPSSRRLR